MVRPAAHRSALLVAALTVLTGCSATAIQCGGCPPSAFVNIDAGDKPAGTTVRVCLQAHGCTVRVYPAVSADRSDQPRTAPVNETIGLDHLDQIARAGHLEALDGTPVTVTVTPPRRSHRPSRTVHLTARYTNGGDGTCACSYLSAAISLPGR